MRILALDIGERRVGVAVGDDGTRVAIPLGAIERSGDLFEAVASLLRQQQAERLLVGLPISLDGSLGPQGQRVQVLAQELAARLPVPVETWDERLTSVEARRRLRSAKHKGRTAVPAGRQDALAAAIILQAYLDSLPGGSSSL